MALFSAAPSGTAGGAAILARRWRRATSALTASVAGRSAARRRLPAQSATAVAAGSGPASASQAAPAAVTERILDDFWRARGVTDAALRRWAA